MAAPRSAWPQSSKRLRYTGIDEILEDGLHSRLTEFIDTVRELARAIHRSYLEVV
jgi:uncharacterized alpha-E superfamily protein